MKNIFRTRYRIVQIGYENYTSEYRLWWWPFWVTICHHQTIVNAERAIDMARDYPVVIKEM